MRLCTCAEELFCSNDWPFMEVISVLPCAPAVSPPQHWKCSSATKSLRIVSLYCSVGPAKGIGKSIGTPAVVSITPKLFTKAFNFAGAPGALRSHLPWPLLCSLALQVPTYSASQNHWSTEKSRESSWATRQPYWARKAPSHQM